MSLIFERIETDGIAEPYAERMPVAPGLGAGLKPLLQITLLPPLTFWIAGWAGRSPTKEVL